MSQRRFIAAVAVGLLFTQSANLMLSSFEVAPIRLTIPQALGAPLFDYRNAGISRFGGPTEISSGLEVKRGYLGCYAGVRANAVHTIHARRRI